jgi:putative transposase
MGDMKNPHIRDWVAEYGYTAHIKARGEEITAKQEIPERTHSWMNRFRRLLIRWEKKADNYSVIPLVGGTTLAMVHFACAFISFRFAKVFG